MTTINGRTPEEIKKGLECCNTFNVCHKCPYEKAVDTEHGWGCVVIRNADTLAYIQHLETELAEARKDVDMLSEQVVALDGAYNAMKRERDAAVERLARYRKCIDCVRYPEVKKNLFCDDCVQGSKWQWCGEPLEVK